MISIPTYSWYFKSLWSFLEIFVLVVPFLAFMWVLFVMIILAPFFVSKFLKIFPIKSRSPSLSHLPIPPKFTIILLSILFRQSAILQFPKKIIKIRFYIFHFLLYLLSFPLIVLFLILIFFFRLIKKFIDCFFVLLFVLFFLW